MRDLVKDLPDALVRLLVVVAMMVCMGTFVFMLIPKSLKDVRIQQADAIKREQAKPVKFAGAHACADCHEHNYEEKKTGFHRDLSCETCHGASKAHTEDPTSIKPVIPKERQFCVLCHAYNPSRPKGFPQINPMVHNPLKPCASCHNPHDPKPPTTPRECSACHGEIARMKAVSHHVALECTTCHQTPSQHKLSPRTVKPTKPQAREFCGQCHAKGTGQPKGLATKHLPKVDMATHGEKYVCWQCHYPHSPEVE